MPGAIFDARTSPARTVEKHRGVRRVPVGSHHGVIRLAEGAVADWLTQGVAATWSPPRHLLLDQARLTLGTPPPLIGEGSGQGVVIGIIDGGVDVSHPDLRNPDGTTRVAWWIDFSSSPAGLHPELEAAFGCEPEEGLRCRILDAADIDERLQNGVAGDEPRDPSGHGTHIASIAAGNGLAGGAGFVGIAPEATLIVARITGAAGTIADSDVVLATEFVFARALELGLPAVANLSLGGDFGAHDGSSELSRVLASFVGDDVPGRAIVVAGGNSGELQRGLTTRFPEPLGIHTEVVIRPGSAERVPLLMPLPSHGGELTDASLFIWLNLSPAAALTVTLELADGLRSKAVTLGQTETLRSGELVAAVVHGVGDEAGTAELAGQLPDLASEEVLPTTGAAVILVDGRWPSGEVMTIEVAGEGRAELWVQSEGDLAPETGSLGAVFPSATPRRTVTIPATHPELIAVGASINRLGWTAHTGAEVDVSALRAPALALGGAAFFSSAGPNALGDVKPDVVAPGAFVIASMAASADPRRGGPSIFAGGLCAGPSCQVVGDSYAVTAGTSMAAPMVSGAVALLLERDPTLTQNALRRLLQAGSTPLGFAADVVGREGGGVLSITRSLEALPERPRGEAERPDVGQSRLRAAADLVVPDPSRSIAALLWLRDAEGAVFDAALSRVRATASGGQISQSMDRVGAGLYELRVAALPGAKSLSIEVFVDDELFLTHRIPIESGDPDSAREGGCSAVASPRAGSRLAWGQSLVWLALLCSRRRLASCCSALRFRSGTP